MTNAGQYGYPPKQDFEVRAFQALMEAHGEVHDFAGWLTELVAGVTAHVGGLDELIEGRPGSWEASHVEDWMRAAGCESRTQLARHHDHWVD